MRIVGIDPAIASMGYATLASEMEASSPIDLIELGTLETPPHRPEGERLLQIRRWFESFLASRQPAAVAMERPALRGKLAYNGLPLGMAYGVILCTCEAAGVRVFEYMPNTVKLVSCGIGNAGKPIVRAAIRERFGDGLKGRDDGFDAAAVALTHIIRQQDEITVMAR